MGQGVDTISKPLVWDHDASAVSLETQPAFKTTEDGNDGNPTPSHPGVTSILGLPVSSVYTMRKLADIEQ